MMRFDPAIHIQSITIVGLGGTGAQVARSVGRILYDMRRSNRHIPSLYLIDPDKVEDKNIGRQLFADSDIGMYKAEVVSRRLNFGLGLMTSWVGEPVDAKRHLSSYSSGLVISCVDNHEARRELHKSSGVMIGAGNHADSGQIVIGNTKDAQYLARRLANSKKVAEGVCDLLPYEGLLFPQLLDPDPATIAEQEALSCADLIATGDQHLLVNDWMAMVVGQYVYKLLHRQPIYSFMTYVDSDGMGVRSIPITVDALAAYIPELATEAA